MRAYTIKNYPDKSYMSYKLTLFQRTWTKKFNFIVTDVYMCAHTQVPPFIRIDKTSTSRIKKKLQNSENENTSTNNTYSFSILSKNLIRM